MKRQLASAVAVACLVLSACSSGESALDAGNDDEPASSAEPAEPTTASSADDSVDTDGSDASLEAADTQPAATATTTSIPAVDLPDCPTDALDAADGPVEITYWHGMTGENEESLIVLVDEYNASQDRVVVDLQNQGGYLEVIDKYYQSGDDNRPALVMFPEYGFQQAIDSASVIPAQSCSEASDFDTEPVLPAALSAYATEGVQWGLPFNVSNPILYYNKSVFEAAGLDPEVAPTSLDELRSMSQQIVDSGAANYGLAFDSNIDSGGGWFIEQWFANAGVEYVDNGNGRSAPATEALFAGDTGVELLTFFQQLQADGLAFYVGGNASGQDSFLKVADQTDPASMVIGTSAGLGTVLAVLGSGLIDGVTVDDIGVAPFPGLTGEPSVAVGGAANYVVSDDDPVQMAAAWDLATFLLSAESQSTWAARTGYVPIVSSALDVDPIKTTYADDPRFRVAYDQLAANDGDPASSGPLIGPHRQVRVATADAMAAVMTGTDVATALTQAQDTANRLLTDYNALNQ